MRNLTQQPPQSQCFIRLPRHGASPIVSLTRLAKDNLILRYKSQKSFKKEKKFQPNRVKVG
uniref:Uncharacterized protein n=1 Tax=Rhizophora mucronata TaxID=61149 RepID=A0A2P2IPI6_RHIMU